MPWITNTLRKTAAEALRGITVIKETSTEKTNVEESDPVSSLWCKWDNYQGYLFKKYLSVAHEIKLLWVSLSTMEL